MKQLFFILLVLVTTGGLVQGQAFLEDFEGTTGTALPAGWTQVNAGTGTLVGWRTGTAGTLSSSFFVPSAHTRFVAVNDDAGGINGNNSNDLLASPSFSLASVAHPFLHYDVYYFAAGTAAAHESLTVEVSVNGGTNWTVIATDSGITTGWLTRQLDLSAYQGMTGVQVGFRYGDGGQVLFGAALDNINVIDAPAAELALTAINPTGPILSNFTTVGTTVPVTGTVKNFGYSTITQFVISYQLGNGAVINELKTPVNIPSFATYNFSFTTPLAIPNAVGNYPVKIWVNVAGDPNPANDSMATSVNAVSFLPAKKLTFEQSLGTTCGNCVRGIVYMDSLWNNYPGSVSLVNVHHADPMTVPAYDNFIGNFPGFGIQPGVLIDRREVSDPGDLINAYTQEHNYFGFADLVFGSAAWNGSNLTLPVSVKPAADLTGGYKLALVLTEDQVTGTSSGYDQANDYSLADFGNTIPLSGDGYDFLNLPGTIPASQMHYDFVARSVVPAPAGAANSLPDTLYSNNTYNYTFSTTVDPAWKNVRMIAMLVRTSDGQVLNSNYKTLPLGVVNPAAGIRQLSVFPNPARDEATVRFNLKETGNITLVITDALGRMVNKKGLGTMAAGNNQAAITTGGLASGLYMVTLSGATGSVAVKLSVVR